MAQDEPIGTTVADRSLQIATALSAEVVVLRERLEIVERLAAAHGLFGPDDVEPTCPISKLPMVSRQSAAPSSNGSSARCA